MTLLTTVGAAFVLVVLALAFIGIGAIITGKNRIIPGACGRVPKKNRDDHCGTDMTCDLCKSNDDDIQQKQSRDD